MTIVMARELERLGVRVNAIAPVARTRLTEGLGGDAMKPDESGFDKFAPENVAAVACWLASDGAQGISGQVVKVQGGTIQLLEGWRPLTEVSADEEWTLQNVGGLRDEHPREVRRLGAGLLLRLAARGPGAVPGRVVLVSLVAA